jgi:hypothetical protein
MEALKLLILPIAIGLFGAVSLWRPATLKWKVASFALFIVLGIASGYMLWNDHEKSEKETADLRQQLADLKAQGQTANKKLDTIEGNTTFDQSRPLPVHIVNKDGPVAQSKPSPCFHPVKFKSESVKPEWSNYPYRLRVTITPSGEIANPRIWVFTDKPTRGEPDQKLRCNWSAVVGTASQYNCPSPIGPQNPMQITLDAEEFPQVICVDDRSGL